MDLFTEFERVSAQYGSNWTKLSERDQTLLVVWELEAEVNNGGFEQYFFNSAGDLARDAPSALRRIGASKMADVVEAANATFGPKGPPANREARQSQLESLVDTDESMFDAFDQRFTAYPDDLATLLAAYLETA